jgi:hypothetical protein
MYAICTASGEVMSLARHRGGAYGPCVRPLFAVVGLVLVGCTGAPPVASDGHDAWVDPELGADDLAHGGAPGTSAFRTITFALAHASATIHLDDGTYAAASGEQFPLVLTGGQALEGDPGLGAHIAGNGALSIGTPTNPLDTTIALSGDDNRVEGCDVTTTDSNPDWSPACVRITTSGPHVIRASDLHDCPIAIDLGGQAGITISDVTTGDVSGATAGNCLNDVGDNVTVVDFSCRSSNDWVFGCGSNFSGCGTMVLGRVAACTDDLSGFSRACPP